MRTIVLALVASVAAGCASVAQRPPVSDTAQAWQARQSAVAPLKRWNLQGRLSARTSEDGWQASVRWVRNQDRHDFDLWGPLGRGHVRLRQDEHGAELRDAEQRTFQAPNGEELLLETTGWWLPLEGLNYWVLGLPVPGVPGEQVLDQWGRLKTLRQLGWDVDFLQYRQHGGYELPSRLSIRRHLNDSYGGAPGSTSLRLEVRLVIERWTLTP